MEDTTEHVVQTVLPDVPIRQWVLSMPFQLRPMVAFQPGLFAAVIRVFMSEVSRYTTAKAKSAGIERPLCGGIAFLQRFGSTVNLNPHIHAIVLDGAYLHTNRSDSKTEPELEFRPIPAPTAKEIEEVSRRVSRRVIRLFQRRGIANVDGLIPKEIEEPSGLVQEDAARVLPLFAFVRDGYVDPIQKRSAHGRSGEVRGFSTHGAVFAGAGDKEGRRRIVRYCVRPPFAEKQLSSTRDGRVAFELRHPRSNGATHVVFTELGFVKKLAAIVPPPRQHQARYFGLLSSASPLRRFVVPSPPLALSIAPVVTAPSTEIAAANIATNPRRASWAALLRRIYDVDALRCPTCNNGGLRIIAAIIEPRTVRKILTHLDLDDTPPPPRRTPELRWADP